MISKSNNLEYYLIQLAVYKAERETVRVIKNNAAQKQYFTSINWKPQFRMCVTQTEL